MKTLRIAALTALLLLTVTESVFAEWNTNIAKNNQVTPTDVEFYDQQLLTTSDGYTYCYFIVPGNKLMYRVQIVNPDGNLVCRAAGLTVSNKLSATWTKVNYPTVLDNEGNLIMAVQDMRTRNDSKNETYLYTLYKINKQGEIVWEHSLNDSISSYDNSYITLSVAPDNSIYAAFGEVTVGYQSRYLHIERMDENGKSLWAEPLIIGGQDSDNYTYPTVKALSDNSAIVGFLNYSNSHYQLQKIDADGTLIWDSPKDIYTGSFGSSYVWQCYEMRQLDDNTFAFETLTGDKTTVVTCFDADGINLTSDGEYTSLTTVDGYGISLDDFDYDSNDAVLNIGYRQIDLDNTYHHGIYLQQLGTDGTRYFGDEGFPVVEMQEDDQYGYTQIRKTDTEGECAVFYIKKDTHSYTAAAQCYMCKIGYDMQTTLEPVAFTSSQNTKSDLHVSDLISGPDGSYYLASWLEKRGLAQNASVYMQRVYVDGRVETDTTVVPTDTTALAVTTVSAGTLSSLIPGNKKYSITKLTVNGPINGTDISFLRDMMGMDAKSAATDGQLSELNLSGATIQAGGDAYYSDMGKDIDYYVTEDNKIPHQAFTRLTQLTNIVLPASATEIGDSAFYYTKSLTNVTFPASLTKIGSYAFSGTSLTDVTVPASCLSMGRGVFNNISTLNTLVLPDALKEIPASIVSSSGLTSISWPKSCTKISDGAFAYCTRLAEADIPEGVTEICPEAFCGIKTLATVSFPSTLKTIGNGAFEYCSSLTEANLPQSVTSLGEEVFYSCNKLASVTLPEGLTTIPNRLFGNSYSLASVNVPAGLVSIGDQAFNNCYGITSFDIPESVTSIGFSAFESVPLEGNLVLPAGLKTLKYNAFAWTNISSFNIPAAITKIPDECFESCNNLEKINIPEGVTSVGQMAFGSCTGVKSITLPSTLTTIGFFAFSYCENCTSVKSFATTPGKVMSQFTRTMAFNDMDSECVLYVPEGSKEAYEASTPWNVFASIEEFDPSAGIAGDVNGDGVVDIADVNAVLSVIFGSSEYEMEADVDGDGVVDIADVNAVLSIMFAE